MSQLLLTTKLRSVVFSTGASVALPLVWTRIAGVSDTKIGGGSAFSPFTSSMRFDWARLAVTRSCEIVSGPVGRSPPSATLRLPIASRSSAEKSSLVSLMLLMTISLLALSDVVLPLTPMTPKTGSSPLAAVYSAAISALRVEKFSQSVTCGW